MPNHTAAHQSPAATDRCVVAFLAVALGVAVATQSGPPLPPRDVARFWAAAGTYGVFFAATFLPGYTAPRSRFRDWCAFALRAVVLPLVIMALVQAPVTLRTLTVGPRDGAAATGRGSRASAVRSCCSDAPIWKKATCSSIALA